MSDNRNTGEYIKIAKVADMMHVSTGRLREWIREGELKAKPRKPGCRIWVSLKSVKSFIARHTVNQKH